MRTSLMRLESLNSATFGDLFSPVVLLDNPLLLILSIFVKSLGYGSSEIWCYI